MIPCTALPATRDTQSADATGSPAPAVASAIARRRPGRPTLVADGSPGITAEATSATQGQVAPVLDPERQRTARVYAREQRRLLLANLLLSVVLVVGFLISGASQWLKDALLGSGLLPPPASTLGPWLLVAVYVAIVLAGYTVLSGPLSWYSTYVVPHRYGMSTQTRRGWLSDELKTAALSLIVALPVAEVIYWLLRSRPDTWWLWAAAFLIALSLVFDYVLPVIIVPLFYKLTPLQDPLLVERVQRLAQRTGTRVAGTYTINLSSRTRAANAMVMGLGRTKRIALGDTLYKHFTPDEIETILAHELAHQVHRDVELSLALQAGLTVGGLLVAKGFLDWGVPRFGFESISDIAALPLLLIAVGVFSLVTMPLSNGLSRWREGMADRYAITVTGNGPAFAAALTRLANQNLAEADPPRWVVWLLYSHPPLRERIALGRAASAHDRL